MADDALGPFVAEELRRLALPGAEITSTAEAGFHLFDYLLDVACLVVIDTIVTGTAAPGTIYSIGEGDLPSAPGVAPHYIGLQEALVVARALDLPAAKRLVVLAVEGADCLTFGGTMHPAVRAAIPLVVEEVKKLLENNCTN